MKTISKIKMVLLLTILAISFQSCHIGFGLGIGAAKDKNTPDKKTELSSNTIVSDTNKNTGPTISK